MWWLPGRRPIPPAAGPKKAGLAGAWGCTPFSRWEEKEGRGKPIREDWGRNPAEEGMDAWPSRQMERVAGRTHWPREGARLCEGLA